MWKSLGTWQSHFSTMVGAKIRRSLRVREKKLTNSEYHESKQLLRGRPEWTWNWRGSVSSREGFFFFHFGRDDNTHIETVGNYLMEKENWKRKNCRMIGSLEECIRKEAERCLGVVRQAVGLHFHHCSFPVE